jgi:hypothetical protein
VPSFALFVHVFFLRLAGGIIDLREGGCKMEKEHVDPAFSYTDANVKKLKKELSKELENLQDSLLQTQRFLASLQIRVVHNESISNAAAYSKAASQFSSEVTSALIKVASSNQPLAIAEEFTKRRWDDLEKFGIKSIKIKR